MECSRGMSVFVVTGSVGLSICYISASHQIISALHRRFPKTFTPAFVSSLSAALAAPSRAALAALSPEQREKEDAARISRQRPVLRVSAELALVGIIKDAPDRSGGEWIMKVMRDLVSLPNVTTRHVEANTSCEAIQRPYLVVSASSDDLPEVVRSAVPRHCSACFIEAGCISRGGVAFRGYYE